MSNAREARSRRMTRTGKILLALAALLLVGPRASLAAEIALGSATVAAGASGEVAATLVTGVGESLAAISLDIDFDPTVLGDPPNCEIEPSIGAGTGPDKTLIQSAPAAGQARIGVLGIDNSNVIPDGVVFRCTFTADPSAPTGDYPLTPLGGAASSDGDSAPVTAQPGTVTIQGGPGGDADGDGIPEDGMLASCASGETSGCSDNCPAVSNASQADQDGDAVGDACDLCTAAFNPRIGEVQLDTDDDGFGNLCDCDFDQDGSCNILDFDTFLGDFQTQTDSGLGTDMNGDGNVNILDFDAFLSGFSAGAPGPSAAAP